MEFNVDLFIPVWVLWIGGIFSYLLLAVVVVRWLFWLDPNNTKEYLPPPELAGPLWPLFVPILLVMGLFWVLWKLSTLGLEKR